MANIQEILTKILSSRYGKDMRQAIHDGIQQCYDDATEDSTAIDSTLSNSGEAADAKATGDALKDKLDTNQGSGNKGKVMIVGDDGSLKPDDVNIADKSVTFNKLGEDIATKISVRPEYELLKSDITQYSGWIKFDELVNIIAIFNTTVKGNVRVYYFWLVWS